MKSDPDLIRREEEELARAIQLSLKETSSSISKTPNNSTNSLYANLSQSSQRISQKYSEKRKVKALYDFEAAEDNEITFKAGDVLVLTDDSDQNWWKGIDTEGTEGLFPSNFVTFDMDEKVEGTETAKKVSFSDNVDVNVIENEPRQLSLYIDESKIDRCIEMLQNSDPTGEIQPDTQELLDLEEECYMMGPLIDQKLQLIDQKHSQLEDLNVKIIESFQMYNNLMKESITKASSYINPMMGVNSQVNNPQYVAAPPSIDQNSIHLANQLNSMSLNMQPQYPSPSQYQAYGQPMAGPYQNQPNGADPSYQNQYLTNQNV